MGHHRRIPPRYIRNMPPVKFTKKDFGCLLWILIILIWLIILFSFGMTEETYYNSFGTYNESDINTFGWIWMFLPLWFPFLLLIILKLFSGNKEIKTKRRMK